MTHPELPNNIEAEKATLGSILLNREAIVAVNTNASYHGCARSAATVDVIDFDLGTGTPTIAVTGSELPRFSGPLIVDGATLAEVLEELRRHYAGLVVLRDRAFTERRVSGVFDLRRPIEAL